MTVRELEDWLVLRIADELGCPPDAVDTQATFAQLGLDSAAAVFLSGQVEELLRVKVPQTAVFEHPTIERLAAHLAAPGGAR